MTQFTYGLALIWSGTCQLWPEEVSHYATEQPSLWEREYMGEDWREVKIKKSKGATSSHVRLLKSCNLSEIS